MTRHNPERTVAVKISETPKSSAYVDARRGQQALPARKLRTQIPRPKKERIGDQQLLPGMAMRAWYEATRALLERHFGNEEPLEICARDLGIPFEDAQSMIARAISISEKKISLKFHLAAGSNQKYPMAPKELWVKELSEKIGRELDTLNESQPELIEEVVLFYASNVQKNNRLEINLRKETTRSQGELKAPKLRKLVSFVRQLKIEELSIRAIGFKVKGKNADLREHLKLVGLPATTPIHWVNATNQNSLSALEHLAIDIVCTFNMDTEPVVLSSEAFRYVMAVAAITQIWRIPKNRAARKSKPPMRASRVVEDRVPVQQSFFC